MILLKQFSFINALFLLNIYFLSSNLTSAQGVIQDDDKPFRHQAKTPYEMANRNEARVPLVTFEDDKIWELETENSIATLTKTQEQQLYRKYCGKLSFKATDKKASITVRLKKPIVINNPWDCIDFWNYGAHWLWGEPKWETAMRHFAIIEGADGQTHELDFTQAGYPGMIHKYWHLSHIKVNEDIKMPAKLIGVRFKGRRNIPDLELDYFLGPIYVYQEQLKPITFNEWPEKLPFPVRDVTILPLNKSAYTNTIKKTGKNYLFTYEGDDQKLQYELNIEKGLLSGITVKKENLKVPINEGAEIYFEGVDIVNWDIRKSKIKNDTVFVNAVASFMQKEVKFSVWYTIKQKSLIVGIHEEGQEGQVSSINLGSTKADESAKLVTVPFLTYGENRMPQVLYSHDLFFFKQLDWYYSDASDFIPGRHKIKDGWASYSNGIRYIPKTNGIRNPVKEKIFINVSTDVQEVLPTVDNPKSPMRSVMAHRLWMVEGTPDHDYLKQQAKELRALGLKEVAVRYHEGIWRDGGESYTFRTETAPGRGGNAAVQRLVENIKSKGWLVGLYSNYTDFAPVNANWDPDWVKREPNGGWEVSWSRCYSPKPMIAVEQQEKLAPQIHKAFGTNHSYCDVHTAVSPISRVDYDYRVPGAATFRRSYECYGLVLMNEKKAYHGPVYSEGNYHWWYAGLVDGNYANFNPKLNKIDVFPDFQLLKIHPLEMDAGNVYTEGAEYLAYTLAYGHIGLVNGDIAERIKRYAMLQPLQPFYSMIPIRKIQYFDGEKFVNSSEAIKNELLGNAQLALEYESGFKVFVNFADTDWTLEAEGKQYILPKFGFMAYQPQNNVISVFGKVSDWKSNGNAEFNMTDNQIYIDSHGTEFETDDFKCNGRVYFKNENFGWEIIPANDFEYIAFNPAVIGCTTKVLIQGLDINDRPMGNVPFQIVHGKIQLEHHNKSILKYRIVQVQ
ncbi:hypothetical protein KEM09_14860 [Carboxylicivirga mesophila]|uniref:Uncharacterized protein n=1 Tax=Carboxylicivirga mesophila TaxID=1166478 RepID=A0ABS5KCU8_9BACT|nr:hypothetical protein [Carboxylicivirga mesophila]MBS2212697.1 hypothetical protein [Carboxylicivirga mesophila]